MKIPDFEKARLIRLNEAEYKSNYDLIPFVAKSETGSKEALRTEIIVSMKDDVVFGYKNTKLDAGEISPGCKICGEGSWSCLFINGKCNCRCFYCPTSQNSEDMPTTSTLEFPEPQDYIDYIEKFGFKGISLSGGEPLLTFEKTIRFLRAIRQYFGNEKYIWLYTNGALLDEEKVKILQEAGLDEMRFDLSARNYMLDKIKLAVGKIPNVTVEVPAIPEDIEILKKLVKDLHAMGVNYLNLHQMRLTPYNFDNLLKRNYTFLHGKKVTVLDSELTALQIIRFTKENKIPLPVNYCSFVYKNRFQGAAARMRLAPHIMEKYETLSENGYVRRMTLKLGEAEYATVKNRLLNSGFESGLYRFSDEKQQIIFHPDVLRDIAIKNTEVEISYYYIKLLPSLSYRNPFMEIRLNENRKITLERIDTGSRILLNPEEYLIYFNMFLRSEGDFTAFENIPKWSELAAFEWIEEGLQEYF